MSDSIIRISLDLQDSSSKEIVELKRTDSGRYVHISLFDGGVPYMVGENQSAAFIVHKPNGNFSYEECDIDGYTLIYKVSSRITQVPGEMDCEIKFYKGTDGTHITGPTFGILVDDTVYDYEDEVETPVSPTRLLMAPHGCEVGQYLRIVEVNADGTAVALEPVESPISSYYTPAFTQVDDKTIKVGLTKSEEWMPDAPEQTFTMNSDAADQAAASAETAEAAKNAAAGSATAAAGSATSAAGSAEDAENSATAAGTAKSGAETAKGQAENFAKEAKSYAKGGTGTRSGENTDNAMYYANQARQSVEQAETDIKNAKNTAVAEANNAIAAQKAEAITAVGNAKNSAVSSAASEINAKTNSALTAIDSAANNAEATINTLVGDAEDAAAAAENAKMAAQTAKSGAETAKTNAEAAATNAANSANSASGSASGAATSAANAAGSAAAAQSAQDSAEAAAQSAQDSAEAAEAVALGNDIAYVNMLDTHDYHEVMAAWFRANGSLVMLDLTALAKRWYTITRKGWRGGTTFNMPSKSSVSTGTKTGDNAGLSVTPSTNTVAGRDDYASLPLFAPTDCNVKLDTNGEPCITAIEGVPSGNVFDRYDTTKIVGVLQQTGWCKYAETADEYSYEYTDIPELTGFHPLPEAVSLADNSVRPFVVHAKYGLNDGWGSCSGQKQALWTVSHNTCLSNIRSKWGTRYCGKTSADDAFVKWMCYIKYGALTFDGKMNGCTGYTNQCAVAVAETGVSRVLLTSGNASGFVIGSSVIVGDRGTSTTTDRYQAVLRNKASRAVILSKEDVTVNGTAYVALNLDCDTFDITDAATTFVSTIAWGNGCTDNVLGNDGSPVNNTDGKNPFKIQGIEMMYGCYEVLGDTIWNYEQVNGSWVAHGNVCRDATKLTTSLTADYKETAYSVPCPASNSWNYIRKLGNDPALPEAMFPCNATGGSSSTFTRDAAYLLASSSSLSELLSLGTLDSGGYAGLSGLRGVNGLGDAYWNIGGRLSLTGNRGEYAA